jgi:hypothetical protein
MVQLRFAPRAACVVLAALFTLAFTPSLPAQSTSTSSFNVLYSFTGGADGYQPGNGLVFGSGSVLYGTTFRGATVNGYCPAGCGTVFSLTQKNGSWSLDTIHSFAGYPTDVSNSYAQVTLEKNGTIFGTGGSGGAHMCGPQEPCGGVFKLAPSGDDWKESVIYNFNRANGFTPYTALTLQDGVFYGTTWFGPASDGNAGNGTIFSLTSEGKAGWKHVIIHTFEGGSDGAEPYGNLVFDTEGNAYGSTPYGGTANSGDIFELYPSPEGGWTEQILYSFPTSYVSGAYPSTLILDSKGNLYGVTNTGGQSGTGCGVYDCGTVFELEKLTGGSWQLKTLYEFAGGSDGYSPAAGLVFDAKGNLYGTTLLGGESSCQFVNGAPGCGTVFELSPSGSGSWSKKLIYSFQGSSDGEFPTNGSLIFDSSGNLYGATAGNADSGGSGYGTIYQITP